MDLTTILNQDLIDLRKVFNTHGFDVRLVGGAVRDLLSGVTPKDIDLCTDADPLDQIMIYKAAGYSYYETGLAHGTITVVINHVPYEITSLRVESDHDGRHAAVSYTRDWIADLGRRDLTFNAMALTFDGQLIDPFGGAQDLGLQRVRFVGNPDDRMREDYLRILRWLRFQGRIAPMQSLDPETVEAALRQAEGLRGISRERVWMEVSKIIAGPGGANLIDSMYDLEIARHIDLPMGLVPRLRLVRSYSDHPITLMVALLNVEEWPDMAGRWKWSAEERDMALFLVRHHGKIETTDEYKRLVAHDGHSMEWVTELARLNVHLGTVLELSQWEVPVFPVRGADLRDAGMAPGPQMGKTLADLKAKWAASGYALTKEALLAGV